MLKNYAYYWFCGGILNDVPNMPVDPVIVCDGVNDPPESVAGIVICGPKIVLLTGIVCDCVYVEP